MKECAVSAPQDQAERGNDQVVGEVEKSHYLRKEEVGERGLQPVAQERAEERSIQVCQPGIERGDGAGLIQQGCAEIQDGEREYRIPVAEKTKEETLAATENRGREERGQGAREIEGTEPARLGDPRPPC